MVIFRWGVEGSILRQADGLQFYLTAFVWVAILWWATSIAGDNRRGTVFYVHEDILGKEATGEGYAR
jgi:hypothetical protein